MGGGGWWVGGFAKSLLCKTQPVVLRLGWGSDNSKKGGPKNEDATKNEANPEIINGQKNQDKLKNEVGPTNEKTERFLFLLSRDI